MNESHRYYKQYIESNLNTAKSDALLKVDKNGNVTMSQKGWIQDILYDDAKKESYSKLLELMPAGKIKLGDYKAIYDKIKGIFDDSSFKRLLYKYLEQQKINDFAPDFNYFSFKHPTITILNAVADALITIKSLPDENIISEVNDK